MIRPVCADGEKLTGQLNGTGTISGALLAPHVIGNVALSEGEISGPQLPTNFENVQLSVAINGETALLNGGWTSGEKGQGSVSGNVAWGQGTWRSTSWSRAATCR